MSGKRIEKELSIIKELEGICRCAIGVIMGINESEATAGNNLQDENERDKIRGDIFQRKKFQLPYQEEKQKRVSNDKNELQFRRIKLYVASRLAFARQNVFEMKS